MSSPFRSTKHAINSSCSNQAKLTKKGPRCLKIADLLGKDGVSGNPSRRERVNGTLVLIHAHIHPQTGQWHQSTMLFWYAFGVFKPKGHSADFTYLTLESTGVFDGPSPNQAPILAFVASL